MNHLRVSHFHFAFLNDVKGVPSVALSNDVISLVEARFLQAVSDPHQLIVGKRLQFLDSSQQPHIFVLFRLTALLDNRLKFQK